eukprot:5218235-Ditylum_brightwellii.AAC.1
MSMEVWNLWRLMLSKKPCCQEHNKKMKMDYGTFPSWLCKGKKTYQTERLEMGQVNGRKRKEVCHDAEINENIKEEVPRTGDVRWTRKLDLENEAQQIEANILHIMDTFELLLENFGLAGYQHASPIYAWDVKFGSHRKARLPASGKVTIRPPESKVWSRVVTTKV